MFPPGTRILVVDDMFAFRLTITTQLNSLGFTKIYEAPNGIEAMKILRTQFDSREPIELIASDWNMPGGTGIDLLKWVRITSEFSNIPFIMLTAEGSSHQVTEAVQAGVTEYITKPFKVESLRNKLIKVWEVYQATLKSSSESSRYEKISNEIIDAFGKAAVSILSNKCDIYSEIRPTIIKGASPQSDCVLAGLVGITSANINGSILFGLSSPIFSHAILKLLGENSQVNNPETQDVVVELFDIIFGQAATVLNASGHGVRIAVPSVMRGDPIFCSYADSSKVKVVPISTLAGELYLEFLLKENEDRQEVSTVETSPISRVDPTMFSDFLMTFVDSTVKVMDLQCGMPIKVLTPLKRKADFNYNLEIAGIIGITSGALNGSFLMGFSNDCFLKIMSKMVGKEFTSFIPGLEDGGGELVNMILGLSKIVLNKKGHDLKLALPSLIRGTNILGNYYKERPGTVFPIESEVGNFFIEISLARLGARNRDKESKNAENI